MERTAVALDAAEETPRAVRLAIIVAALGYFVDVYDLLLFTVVRAPSLQSLGITGDGLMSQGAFLVNCQNGGLLVGGIVWGMLGDKRGRLSVLFGSILLYSAANIGNGFVQTIEQYAALRFIAGFGLAGELGAGITLVSELMHAKSRGYGTMIVAAVGVSGAIVASVLAELVAWRTSYFVGGGLGLCLLMLRVGVYESGMFNKLKETGTPIGRGNLWQLVWPWPRARRYLAVIGTGIPIWFVVGILINFSPELGHALGLDPAPTASRAVIAVYIGLVVGDVASGAISQWMQSRKKALYLFQGLTALGIVLYMTLGRISLEMYYLCCLVVGLGIGYWAVFVTIAAEQFGTNLRATSTTTAPNFVRGAVIPMNAVYLLMKPTLGPLASAIAVGGAVLVLAVISLASLDETHGKDLDFIEE